MPPCESLSSKKNEIHTIYQMLLAHYGVLNWWSANTPYEVMVGAILTQNTAWRNVEQAIANFQGNLSPEWVAASEMRQLTELIHPAGFFNQKAATLKAMTAWFLQYAYDVSMVQHHPLAKIRAELLSIKGVGRETADSILLYAFSFPSFVVDTYTMRLFERYPILAGSNYEQVKMQVESCLPPSVTTYNQFHALIVHHAQQNCRKKPGCNDCPLHNHCKKHGISH